MKRASTVPCAPVGAVPDHAALARWLPGRRLIVVADHSFSARTFLAAVRPYLALITRLRLDAAFLSWPRLPARGKRADRAKKAPGYLLNNTIWTTRPPPGKR